MHVKPITHRYYLPALPKNKDGWSVVFIDQTTCVLSIVSECGNFAYRWNSLGLADDDFRNELLGFDIGYLKEKLKDNSLIFDRSETAKSVRQKVLKLRRDGGLSKKEARKDWIDASFINDVIDFSQFLDSNTKRYDYYWEHAVYQPSNINGLTRWLKQSWPRLYELIEKDIEENPLDKLIYPK